MAKFCKNCGAQLDESAGFCPGCGAVIEVQPAPQAPPQGGFAPPPPGHAPGQAPPPGPAPGQAPPPGPAQQQYQAPGQQQYAPPPGQQQYAPPPPAPGQQQYAPPPPPPGQQGGYAPPPGQQGGYAPPPQGGYAPPPGQQGAYAPPPSGDQGFIDKVKNFFTNTPDETAYIDPADIAANKTWGGLAYILFFLPFIGCPQSRYGRYHANQGLILLILWVILAVIGNIISFIFLGVSWRLYFIPYIIWALIWIINVAFFVIGLINGLTGKAKELPLIGKFRIIKY